MKIKAEITETKVGGHASVSVYVTNEEKDLPRESEEFICKALTCAAIFLEAVVTDLTDDKEKMKRLVKTICDVTTDTIEEGNSAHIVREGVTDEDT